jgi:endo-1,4-beta-mannosidase
VDRVNTVNGNAYKKDPTVFAWELMNEPRMDCADDPTPDKRYCDKTGAVLRNWVDQESRYVKSLDHRHMVAAGGEAHGLVQTPSGPFQWARDDEGQGNDPWRFQDTPATDVLTFHPYPNASSAQSTFAQTHDLVTGLTRTGVARHKPVVMSEYGIFRSQPITDRAGNVVAPGDPSFLDTRVDWYRMLLRDCYRNGCAGTNVWMLADWSDPDLNVNLYLPKADAQRDAPIVSLLDRWGTLLGGP